MSKRNRANVGCGQTPTEGWQNLDNSPSIRLAQRPILTNILETLGFINLNQKQFINYLRVHNIQWADVTRHIPVPDESLEVVYTSHMLEHLDQSEAKAFLQEARRALAPNGIIRISVPDFRLIIDDYLQHGDADKAVAATHLTIPKPKSLVHRIRAVWVGGRHHHWMYDAKSLSALLIANDFIEPIVQPAGETIIPNPEPLDLYERHDVSLYVEARKPEA